MRTGPTAPGGSSGLVLLVATSVLLTACPREPAVEARPGGWVGEVGPDSVAGVVRQVGNVPFHRTVIQDDDGGVTVVGDLKPEVTQLVGAEVRAAGERKNGGPFGPEFRVTAYEVVSVDGERPYVGVLAEDGEGYLLRTVSGGDLRLATAPIRFEALTGGRLWVTVDERGTVLRYGVLRQPEEMPPEEAS